MQSSNARVQTFCDGVYAIAITLLVLNLKVPPHDSIHSVADLWSHLGAMWPSWFAFLLTFLVLSISWTNHHMIFSTIEGATSHFTYANCFFLLTVVVLPFATALLGEYLNTEYAQPAIVFYCFSALFHNIGWNVFFEATLKPVCLRTKTPEILAVLERSHTQARAAFPIYFALTCFALWFPKTAMVITTALWLQWIGMGLRARVTPVGQRRGSGVVSEMAVRTVADRRLL